MKNKSYSFPLLITYQKCMYKYKLIYSDVVNLIVTDNDNRKLACRACVHTDSGASTRPRVGVALKSPLRFMDHFLKLICDTRL